MNIRGIYQNFISYTKEENMSEILVGKVQYLIKRLGAQELGSQSERFGKTSRGRYLLISKLFEIQSMFPPLSSTELNSNALITLTPLWAGSKPLRNYCNYVYHNSKHALKQEGGRDEFRIYFPKALGGAGFFANDILVFRKEERNDTDVPTYDYLVDWAKPGDVRYEQYNKYLSSKCNYVYIDQPIECFERLVQSSTLSNKIGFSDEIVKRIKELSSKAVSNSIKSFDLTVQPTDTTNSEENLLNPAELQAAKIFNSQNFHDIVLANYGYTCAVTNEVITYGSYNNLEAAHIHPKCHGGTYLPNNGIALRRDIHWAFDKGMFCINDDLKVVVADEVKNSYLGRYDGVAIKPIIDYGRPDTRFLKYHRDHVFKQFITTGALRSFP